MEGLPRIVYLGAGNVAWSLAPALDAVGHVVQVFSPTLAHASALSSRLRDCKAADSLRCVVPDADYYIISVKDDAVAKVAEGLGAVSGIVAHTSGSVPLQALGSSCARSGVFYPLQTFSKTDAVDLKSVPFFIEGSDKVAFDSLKSLAGWISDRVYAADSNHRATLHLAAVFACNFTNNLWAIASDILERDGYSLDVMRPLLEATMAKAMRMHPDQAQTGPAVRGDEKVMAKHRAALTGLDLNIYDTLTLSIENHKRI